MLLQPIIEHVSIVYTCNTYFVMHWSILEYLVNGLIQYSSLFPWMTICHLCWYVG